MLPHFPNWTDANREIFLKNERNNNKFGWFGLEYNKAWNVIEPENSFNWNDKKYSKSMDDFAIDNNYIEIRWHGFRAGQLPNSPNDFT